MTPEFLGEVLTCIASSMEGHPWPGWSVEYDPNDGGTLTLRKRVTVVGASETYVTRVRRWCMGDLAMLRPGLLAGTIDYEIRAFHDELRAHLEEVCRQAEEKP